MAKYNWKFDAQYNATATVPVHGHCHGTVEIRAERGRGEKKVSYTVIDWSIGGDVIPDCTLSEARKHFKKMCENVLAKSSYK